MRNRGGRQGCNGINNPKCCVDYQQTRPSCELCRRRGSGVISQWLSSAKGGENRLPARWDVYSKQCQVAGRRGNGGIKAPKRDRGFLERPSPTHRCSTERSPLGLRNGAGVGWTELASGSDSSVLNGCGHQRLTPPHGIAEHLEGRPLQKTRPVPFKPCTVIPPSSH
jgi:hypothetical protein